MKPKDTSGEVTKFVNLAVRESMPVALTASQVELAFDKVPEITSLSQHILSGGWSRL